MFKYTIFMRPSWPFGFLLFLYCIFWALTSLIEENRKGKLSEGRTVVFPK